MTISALRRLATWGAVWAVIVLALGVLKLAGVEVIDLFKDPIELRGGEQLLPWKGAIGVLGGICWFVGATVCFLAASSLEATDRRRRYLVTTGAVLVTLGFDDALVVHDHLLPYLTRVEWSEKVVLAALAALVAWWGVRYRWRLLASDLVLLGLSGLGLGGAFGLDILHALGLDLPGMGLIEEVSELLGLVTLVGWSTVEARRAIRSPDPLAADPTAQRVAPG